MQMKRKETSRGPLLLDNTGCLQTRARRRRAVLWYAAFHRKRFSPRQFLRYTRVCAILVGYNL